MYYVLVLSIALPLACNAQQTEGYEHKPTAPRVFYSSSGGQDMISVTFNGTFQSKEVPRLTGLDCCRSENGSLDVAACSNRQLQKIFSRWFSRVPDVFQAGMSVEKFKATYGYGEDALKRLRDLAIQVREIIVNRTFAGVQHDVDSSFVPPRRPEVFDDTVLGDQELLVWLKRLQDDTLQKRIITKRESKLWPILPGGQFPNRRAIYYDFDSTWMDDQGDFSCLEAVFVAMRAFERVTCYRFIHVSAFDPNGPCNLPPGYLLFNRDSDEDLVVPQQYREAVQFVSFGDTKCPPHEDLMHIFSHAVGVRHEHQRFDRENYVQLIPGRVTVGKLANFARIPWTKVNFQDSPYDYSSNMHYALDAFKVEAPPLNILNPEFTKNIRNWAHGPTFFDAKTINLKSCYDPFVLRIPTLQLGFQPPPITCEQIFAASGGSCQNNGYVDYNTCKSCICPWGLGGDFCETVQPTTAFGCDGHGVVQVSPVVFKPTCFDVFPAKGTCSWILKSGPGPNPIRLWFENFNLRDCNKQFVEIRANNFGKRAPWYCDSQPPQELRANSFLIHFRSLVYDVSTRFRMCFQMRQLDFQMQT